MLASRPRRLVAGILSLAVAATAFVARPAPVAAAVSQLHGFRATVDGWTSWYGSYGMGPLGTAWCIDHGLRAPDPAYAYARADLSGVPAGTRAAMAWAAGTYGAGSDRVTHAALMLALHDLMGARYPSGRLDVDRLPVTRMAGFGGQEAAVLAKARAVKADALAHRSLRGILRLTLTATASAPGTPTTVTAKVTDSDGRPAAGVTVRFAGAGAGLAKRSGVTGPKGTVAVTARPGTLPVQVTASATVPRLDVDAWTSTTTAAQRVALPSRHDISYAVTIEPAPGKLRIRKTGDAQAWLPVTGARFRVAPVGGGAAVATVEVDTAGAAPAVALAPGRYVVTEVAAPAGYRTAGPWTVEVAAGATTALDVVDEAHRGRLELTKLDALDGEPVAGARFEVHADPDRDGTFDTLVAEATSGTEPVVVEDLLPGDHEVTEVAAPEGYGPVAAPQVVRVEPGRTATLAVANTPRSTVRFRKVPVGRHNPELASLAGAELVVTEAGDDDDGDADSDGAGGDAGAGPGAGASGSEVGRCTTDDDGRCALDAGALAGGARYCWREVRAPIGFAPAEGGCFDAGGRGTTVEVEVAEPSTQVQVGATKLDEATGTPLAGAVYDLYRMHDDDEQADHTLPAPERHPGAPAVDRAAWMAVATSDEDGALTWPSQLPGFRYCARERQAPEGYRLDESLVCTDGPAADGSEHHFELTDEAIPAPPPPAEPEPEGPIAEPPPEPPAPTAPEVIDATVPSLPRTGADAASLAFLGGGLVLLGRAAMGGRRGQPASPSAPEARSVAMRSAS